MKFLLRTNGLMKMKNKGKSKKNKTFTLDFWIYLAIFIALIGGICCFPAWFTEPGKFSYISKFHIIISCKSIVYIVMCFYQETN